MKRSMLQSGMIFSFKIGKTEAEIQQYRLHTWPCWTTLHLVDIFQLIMFGIYWLVLLILMYKIWLYNIELWTIKPVKFFMYIILISVGWCKSSCKGERDVNFHWAKWGVGWGCLPREEACQKGQSLETFLLLNMKTSTTTCWMSTNYKCDFLNM